MLLLFIMNQLLLVVVVMMFVMCVVYACGNQRTTLCCSCLRLCMCSQDWTQALRRAPVPTEPSCWHLHWNFKAASIQRLCNRSLTSSIQRVNASGLGDGSPDKRTALFTFLCSLTTLEIKIKMKDVLSHIVFFCLNPLFMELCRC